MKSGGTRFPLIIIDFHFLVETNEKWKKSTEEGENLKIK